MTVVNVEHDTGNRRFKADVEGGVAELVYSFFDDGVVNLEHTAVPRAARGGGVGDALVRAALAWARERGYRVIATCPFVQRWLSEHPDERPPAPA